MTATSEAAYASHRCVCEWTWTAMNDPVSQTSLAVPRESAASSFAITVHRLGRGGGATLASADAASSSSDAVAQVMMDHAVVGSVGA